MLKSLSSSAPRLLAFDCATSVRSVAVCHGAKVLAHLQEQASQGEAQRLIPLIEAAMAAASMTYQDLDGIAVTLGPGSFTGLRVGLATARGICLAAQKPLLGVTTLEALAGDCSDRVILATVDSRRREPYVQIFHRPSFTTSLIPGLTPSLTSAEPQSLTEPQPLTEPMACDTELLAAVVRAAAEGPIAVIGNCAKDILPVLRADNIDASLGTPSVPSAVSVARIAAPRLAAARQGEPLIATAPLYLRPADAVPARAGGKLRP